MEADLVRLEGGLTPGTAPPATLSTEERARLEALGYVDGAATTATRRR